MVTLKSRERIICLSVIFVLIALGFTGFILWEKAERRGVFLEGELLRARESIQEKQDALFDASARAEDEEKRKEAAIEERDNILEIASDLESRSKIFSSLASSLAARIDEMDAVLLETDSNSVGLIDWMQKNAYFVGDARTEAQYQYDAWLSIQKKTNRDYESVMKGITEDINKIKEVLELQELLIKLRELEKQIPDDLITS